MDLRRVTGMVDRERVWKLESMAVGMVCATITTKLVRAVYRAVRKDKSPDAVFDLTSSRFSWPDALVWAATAGVGLGVAKVVSGRVAAIGWEMATGTLPPGAEEPVSARLRRAAVLGG
jgi:hypothetical protein